MNLLKITIVGAGAIGGVIGAQLAREDRHVELVDVNEEHVKAMNQHGLKIKEQNDHYNISVNAFTPKQLVDKNEEIQCVLLCVKAQHTRSALEKLLPLMNEDSFIVSIQNGLCEIDIQEVVGADRTIGGFVNIFADYLEPGVIEYGGKGSLSIGEMDGSITPRLKELEEELSVLDGIVISQNVLGYLWAKLAYGAMLTATALTNETISDVYDNKRYRAMLMNLAGEVLCVADYEGVKTVAFDDWDPAYAYPITSRNVKKMHSQFDIHVKRLRGYSKVRSGIWRDIVVRKRKTEKPYHFIPIFNVATKARIEMPLIELLLELLSDVEKNERPMSLNNLEILLLKSNELYG